MAPFDPFPPSVDDVPGDPMEDVLALQSYSLESGKVGDFCVSARSIEINCPSDMSSSEEIAM